MSQVNTPAYQYGVKCARSGIIMASHYKKPENVADFESGWRSVCRSHAVVFCHGDGTIDAVHVGTETECNDAAKTFLARNPGSVLRVVSASESKKI
jgi:hypothetical protein